MNLIVSFTVEKVCTSQEVEIFIVLMKVITSDIYGVRKEGRINRKIQIFQT